MQPRFRSEAARCFAGASLLLGCSREPSEIGSPVGVRLQGERAQHDLEMAIALTQGHGEPSVDQVAGALAAARSACPDLAALGQKGQLVRTEMDVVGGRLRAPRVLPSEGLAACVVRGLEGAPMGSAAGEGALAVIEVREAQPPR